MAIKYTSIFHCNTLQNLPKLGFSSENIPSGNPDVQRVYRGTYCRLVFFTFSTSCQKKLFECSWTCWRTTCREKELRWWTGWPRTDAMIEKIFSPNFWRKNSLLKLFQSFLQKMIIKLVFVNNSNFSPKMSKIAENSYHNFNPLLGDCTGTLGSTYLDN
jgi:hypothetical protein